MNTDKTWMLVSDGSRARIFSLKQTPREWQLVRAFEHPESRAHDRDLVTDRAGRAQQDRRGTYGSGFDRPSPHREEAARFTKRLAAMLEAGLWEHAYDRLVIIAPPRQLGVLLAELPPTVRSRVAMHLARDYTSLPVERLDERVRAAEMRGRA